MNEKEYGDYLKKCEEYQKERKKNRRIAGFVEERGLLPKQLKGKEPIQWIRIYFMDYNEEKEDFEFRKRKLKKHEKPHHHFSHIKTKRKGLFNIPIFEGDSFFTGNIIRIDINKKIISVDFDKWNIETERKIKKGRK